MSRTFDVGWFGAATLSFIAMTVCHCTFIADVSGNVTYTFAGADLDNWTTSNNLTCPVDDFMTTYSRRSILKLPKEYTGVPGYELDYYDINGETVSDYTYRGPYGYFKKHDVTVNVHLKKTVYSLDLDCRTSDYGTVKLLSNETFTPKDDADSVFTKTFTAGDSIAIPVPSAEGWDFSKEASEWISKDFTIPANTTLDITNPSLCRNLTLQPSWSAHTYQVSYSYYQSVDNKKNWESFPTDFVSEISNYNVTSYDYDHAFNLSDPSIPGFTFDHWENESGETSATVKIFTKPLDGSTLHLKAYFVPITYSVSLYTVCGDNRLDISSTDIRIHNIEEVTKKMTFTRNDPTFTIAQPVAFGHTFKSWDGSNTNATVAHGTYGNVSFNANFDLNTYEITFDTSGVAEDFKSSFSLNNKTEYYNVKADKVVSQPTCPGYKFICWKDESGNVISNGDLTIMKGTQAKNAKYTACFEPIVYQMTLSDSKNTDKVIDYTIESTINLSESQYLPCSDGYDFAGWMDEHSVRVLSIKPGDALTRGNFVLTAKWDLIKYSISYSVSGIDEMFINNVTLGDGSTFVDSGVYDYETAVTLPTLKCPGYTFNGWVETSDQTKSAKTIALHSTGNKSFTAKFTPVSFKYTLKDVHGNDKINTYNIESTIDLSTEIRTANGYTFNGWKDSDGKIITSINKGDALTRANFELNADWTTNVYSITYDCEGTGITDETKLSFINENRASFTVEDGFELSSPTIPGYDFKYWKDENGNKITNIAVGTYSNKTLTAHFEPHEYTLTINSDHSENKTYKYTVLSTIDLTDSAYTPSSKGYTFGGFVNSQGNAVTKINKNDALSLGDLTLTATWTLNTYSISYACSGVDGSMTSKVTYPTVYRYTYEDTVVLANASCPGYTFNGWLDENGNSVTSIPLNSIGDRTFTASFTINTYTITFKNLKDASISPVNYNVLNSVDLTSYAPESAGYSFVGWTDENGASISSIEALTNGNIDVYAKWNTNVYNISYSVSGVSSEYVSDVTLPTKKTYTYEESYELPTCTLNGYDFAGWIDENGSAVTGISLNSVGDKSFTAKFKPTSYTVTFVNGSSSTDKTYTIEQGIDAFDTLTDSTKVFNGWVDENGNAITSIATGTTGNRTITASWSLLGSGTEEDPYLVYDAEQLAMIANSLDSHYKLMKNVSISSWSPIGTSADPFNGTLDGNGYSITFNISNPTAEYYSFGLFAYAGADSVFNNLTIKGSIGSSSSPLKTNLFGSIAGYCAGVINNATVQTVVYTESNSEKTIAIGGLVGYGSNAYINNSTFGNGSVGFLSSKSEADVCFVGGIMGYGTGGRILDCSVMANIVGVCDDSPYVGGVLGTRDSENPTQICATTEAKYKAYFNASDPQGYTNSDRTNQARTILGHSSYSYGTSSQAAHADAIDGAYYYAYNAYKSGSTVLYYEYLWKKWSASSNAFVDFIEDEDYYKVY